MIEVKNLSVRYQEGEQAFLALKDIQLMFPDSGFVSVVGRSGSGKSTLLNAMGGLAKPTEGAIIYNHENIYEKTDKELAKYRSENIGYIFQEFYLENTFTVYQNVEIALMVTKYPRNKRKEKIHSLLEKVGMLEKCNVNVGKLSGGEKQRVCIARALINGNSVILADEPCGNLDSYHGDIVMKLLEDLAKEGKLVVLVTHNLEDAKKTNRIIELRDGIVIKDENI